MAQNSAIEGFIRYQKAADKSDLTLKSYQSDLVIFAQWFEQANGESLRLHKVTPTDLRQYKQHLDQSGFKPQTINRRLCCLKYFLEWGWKTKKISYRLPSPKLVKQMRSAPKWLDKTEQNALLRHMERYAKPRDIAIVKILMNTGLRVQELCDLTWQDIILTERKGRVVVKRGKGNKYREIPLNKDARHAFLDLDYQQHAGSDGLIFLGQRGVLSARGIQLILKRRLQGTALDDITPHQLRHTFCKNLVNTGVGLEKVALLAGHESLDTTRLYCQPSLSDLSDAVEKIGEEE